MREAPRWESAPLRNLMWGCHAYASTEVGYSSGISVLTGASEIMDQASFSAFAALAGSAIGRLTSLTGSWLTQDVQLRAQQRTENMSRREELYKNLIDETSRLYGDAYEHDEARRGSGEGVHAEKARHAEERAASLVLSFDKILCRSSPFRSTRGGSSANVGRGILASSCLR